MVAQMAGESPLVTVLTAVYNGEKTIRRLLDMVFAQTCGDFEILVVNDGSTDKTDGVLNSIASSKLRVMTNGCNLGLTVSLHRGILEARGKYVARLDDGYDRVSHRWLEKCVAPLERDEEVVLCGPRTRSYRGGVLVHESSQPTDPSLLAWIFPLHNCVAHVGSVFRRVVGGEVQNYDVRLRMAQDYELWTRLARLGKVCVVPEVLVELVEVKGGLTVTRRAEQEFWAARVRAAQQNWLLGRKDVTPELANAAAGVYWRWHGLGGRDALRGSLQLCRLRRSYLTRFGTPAVAKHLAGRFYGHARWLFRRAEDTASLSRVDAVAYLLSAWALQPSQIRDFRSLQVVASFWKLGSRGLCP